MSTGSISDADEFHDTELLDGLLPFGSGGDTAAGGSRESAEDSSNGEGPASTELTGHAPNKRRKTSASSRRAVSGAALTSGHEGKQVQRNAANARERARMRVLSKAFSRLKTTLPWVPPDTKLSKLDTLRLASSYIAHLRQILANDKHEHGYIHPVNLEPLPDSWMQLILFIRALVRSSITPAKNATIWLSTVCRVKEKTEKEEEEEEEEEEGSAD
ncbi:Transcription factor 21 [Bagarius yarrelli]|uniref:Transcription factor 21 n=1 Tax=Bagarius yarrelli TaxID=175774 RepID=A0A556UYS6_BAGYA|nr:Transcription factor 21 [Bagarius yarrelli]